VNEKVKRKRFRKKEKRKKELAILLNSNMQGEGKQNERLLAFSSRYLHWEIRTSHPRNFSPSNMIPNSYKVRRIFKRLPSSLRANPVEANDEENSSEEEEEEPTCDWIRPFLPALKVNDPEQYLCA
jgi:hypothetical protein